MMSVAHRKDRKCDELGMRVLGDIVRASWVS